MLCRLVEWKPLKIGNTTITLITQTTSAHGNVLSDWAVKNKDREIKLRHIHCTVWDDQSAPPSLAPIIEILNEMLKNPTGHPVVVHCSAGIGRTCTLLGIVLLLERIRKGKDATGVSVMRWLRNQRHGAIQKGIQFVFLHRVTIEVLCQEGVKKASDEKVTKFDAEYQKLLSKQRRFLMSAMKQKLQQALPVKPSPVKTVSEMEVLQTQMDDDEDRKTIGTAEEAAKPLEEQYSKSTLESVHDKEDLPESDYAEFL
ncbi:Protein-tyrosine phosphatase [Ostertagia ostertagi]